MKSSANGIVQMVQTRTNAAIFFHQSPDDDDKKNPPRSFRSNKIRHLVAPKVIVNLLHPGWDKHPVSVLNFTFNSIVK